MKIDEEEGASKPEFKSRFIDIKSVCNLVKPIQLLNYLNFCFLIFLFIFKFDSKLFLPIIKSINYGKKIIAIFTLTLIINILGFSIFCYYVYGGEMWEFSTISNSVIVFLSIVFGDYSKFAKMERVSTIITKKILIIIGFCYSIVFVYWIMIIIIYYHHIAVKEEKEKDISLGNESQGVVQEFPLLLKRLYRSIKIFVENVYLNINKAVLNKKSKIKEIEELKAKNIELKNKEEEE